jgi:hypothetical protein
MRTKIVSAFPGTGKSTFFRNNKDKSIDSDSSEFSWVIDENGNKVRNPDFPRNYIQHIKENIGKYEYIFVSSHKEVRDALVDNCIFFYLAYPSRDRKEEFIKNYKARGDDDKFIELVEKNWDNWILELMDFSKFGIGCKGLMLGEDTFLEYRFKKDLALNYKPKTYNL